MSPLKYLLVILVRETILVYSENRTKPINTPSHQKAELLFDVKAVGTYIYHSDFNS
jgi:hypothetical protein